MGNLLIGIDGGGSKTAVRIQPLVGEPTPRVSRMGGTNLYSTTTSSVTDNLELAIRAAFELYPGQATPEEVVAVCIGTAGIAATGDVERQRRAFEASAWLSSVSRTDRLAVLSDTDIILSVSSAPVRVGVIAGTGSNCLAAVYDARGQETHRAYAGGMGLDLADEGSAAWVGHMACRRALQFHARNEHPQFVRAVYAHLGINIDASADAWREILPVRLMLTKSQLAALSASVVAQLAEHGGARRNPARRLLSDAGRDLVALATAPLRRLGLLAATGTWMSHTPVDFLLVGGMWENDHLFDTFRAWHAFDAPHVRLIRQADPTLGALNLARKLIT